MYHRHWVFERCNSRSSTVVYPETKTIYDIIMKTWPWKGRGLTVYVYTEVHPRKCAKDRIRNGWGDTKSISRGFL